MKLTTIVVNTTIIGCFLTGVGITLDKIESASLSNPFTVRTAQVHEAK